MRAASIASSAIERIAYDDASRELSIWFRESGRYVYYDVPRAVYDALRQCESAGRLFNDCIKGRYRCAFNPERRRFRPAA